MRLQAAIRSDCSWVDVIDKHHAMPHEHAIADGDAFADERMAGYFAIASYDGASLDLDKRPHFGAIPDGASVQVHEIGLDDPYAGSELNVVGNQIWFLTWAKSHRACEPSMLPYGLKSGKSQGPASIPASHWLYVVFLAAYFCYFALDSLRTRFAP